MDHLDQGRWREKSRGIRTKMKMGKSMPLRAAKICLLGLPPNSPRQEDSANVAFGAWRKKKGSWIADVSQCVARRPWGPRLRTLTRNSVVICFSKKRVLCGMELMGAHGWAVSQGETDFLDMGPRVLRDLLGDQMTLPSVGAVILALYLNSHSPHWSVGSSS